LLSFPIRHCKKFRGAGQITRRRIQVAGESEQLTCLDRTIAHPDVLLPCARSLAGMSHLYTVLGILCAALLFGLAACEREGPAEKAGAAVDRAAKDVGDALKGKK